VTPGDSPYAAFVNPVLRAMAFERGREYSFGDVLKLTTATPGQLSWALYFSTLLGRLERDKKTNLYTLVSSRPVTHDDWSRIGIEAFTSENPVQARKAGIKRNAIAEVYTSTEMNEKGWRQQCTVARCTETGDTAMSWGTSYQSIARSLTVLTQECSCGADFHEDGG